MSANLPQENEPKTELRLSLRIFLYLITMLVFGLLFFVMTPGFTFDEIGVDVLLAIFFAINEVLKNKRRK